MKIAMTVGEYNKQGGISRYAAGLVESFINEHEVHVYTTKWKDVSNKNIIFHRVSTLPGPLETSLVPFTIQNTLRLKSLRSQYDIIHTNGSDSLFQDIVTAHSCHKAWVDKYNREKGRPFPLRPVDWALLAIEKQIYEKGAYSKIISVSNSVKNEILRCYDVPEENITVIPNGVDIDEFKPDETTRTYIRDQLKINENELILSFSGYEFHRKGLRHLIEALQLLPENIKLLVIGKDNPVPYMKLAANFGVNERIIFTGFVKKINRYFAASDIFVFPTSYEPFGLVITEAMASGLPVITNKMAGAAELIIDGHNGLLLTDSTNPHEIAQKIRLLAEDERNRKEIGQNARETATKYSWDEIAGLTLKVYKETTANKK